MRATVGLDIGSSAVYAVQVRNGRSGPELDRIGQIDLPPGAVHQGQIVDPDAVVAALKQLWQTHRIGSRKVALGLANQRVVVRRLDLPLMTEAELRASLPLQVDGLIPIPVEEAVLDFCMLGEHQTDDGTRQLQILLVAAQQEMIDQMLDVVRRAGLRAVGVDLDVFAALHSMAAPDVLGEAGAEMLIDVGSTMTDVVVHRNGSPYFARTMLIGGAAITEQIVEELVVDRETAEALKIDPSTATTDEERAAVTDVLAAQTAQIVEEIRGTVDYCAAQRDMPAIERIVLTGGSSRIPQLARQLADAVNLDVATGSPLQAIDPTHAVVTDEQLEADDARLAVAVGLALGAAS
jgi:type IV pilus assembly protein PilM